MTSLDVNPPSYDSLNLRNLNNYSNEAPIYTVFQSESQRIGPKENQTIPQEPPSSAPTQIVNASPNDLPDNIQNNSNQVRRKHGMFTPWGSALALIIIITLIVINIHIFSPRESEGKLHGCC